MENLEIYNNLSKPPASMLKKIKGGRLSGMTDIRPQWRYKVLTEQFGPCGIGWKFDIARLWTEQGSEDQVMCFAHINLYHSGPEWSTPIPGVGGSILIAKESNKYAKEGEPKFKMHSSDEAFKMAVTDALSTAAKMIGVGAAIHEGQWDGSKYKDNPPPQKNDPPTPPPTKKVTFDELKADVDKSATDSKTLVTWRAANTKTILASLDKGEQIKLKSHLDGKAKDFTNAEK